MPVHLTTHEVVRVHRPFRLFDAESYERRYRRSDGVPLPPGYYVVTWPPPSAPGRFDEAARFAGPFSTRTLAEAATRAGAPTR